VTDIANNDRSVSSGQSRHSAPRSEQHNRTISYAAQATDERATYLRIYADDAGETHMQDVDIALLSKEVFEGCPPLRISETLQASGCRFLRVPAGLHIVDWHNPPCRKLVIWLTGVVEIETSDGDIRRVAADSVVLAEDTTGKGHISRHPPEGQLQIMVDLTT
jgi:hypothetical protein